MNDPSLDYFHRSVNTVSKSIGLPSLFRDPPSALDIDAHNEELYDRDDHRQFHVPVLQLRNSFHTVMAGSAADAEAIVRERLRRQTAQDKSLQCTTQIGPAIEA